MSKRFSRFSGKGGSGSAESEAPHDAGQRSKASRQNEQTDALLSNFQGILNSADTALSGVPIPGIKNALSVLKALTERIVKMRANVQDKKDVIKRIEQLLELLRLSGEDIVKKMGDVGTSERQLLQAKMPHSRLKGRVDGFVSNLEDILQSAQEPWHERWYKRAWFANQDAKFLQDIRQRIIEAIKDFKLQGGIDMREMFEDVIGHLNRSEQSARNEADSKILEKLKPANASYKSALIEEKTHLQPGTREKILRDLAEWAANEDTNTRIYVLHGLAGMGKSSIAHALCRESCSTPLGASFFFIRASGECGDAYRLFPTIAYQLAGSKPEFRPLFVAAAKHYLQHSQFQTLEYQLEGLITHALTKIVGKPRTLLIVVDGVDECSNNPNNIVPDMLRFLCRAPQDIPFLRILIATRPETYIMDALRSPVYSNLIFFRNLQQEPDVTADIFSFITAQFQENAGRNGTFLLVTERENAISELTRLSDGLFIYARTVARFLIQNKYSAVKIYDKLVESEGRNGPTRLYEKLDILYSTILHRAFDEFRGDREHLEYAHQVLCWLALHGETSTHINNSLTVESLVHVGIPAYITLDVISRLRSVMLVEEEITLQTELRASHASFPQFLTDNSRCHDSTFLVQTQHGHTMITISLLRFLASLASDDTQSWEQRIWQYARHNWPDHLCEGSYTEDVRQALVVFILKCLDGQINRKLLWEEKPTIWAKTGSPDCLARVRNWCKTQSADEELLVLLDRIIGKEIKTLVEEFELDSEPFRHAHDKIDIQRWAADGFYTPRPDEPSGSPSSLSS